MTTMTKTNPIADMHAQALQLEDSGRWADAAALWQRIASHKNASKKARAEAKGRAAAARVRAEAKTESAPKGHEKIQELDGEKAVPAQQPNADDQPNREEPSTMAEPAAPAPAEQPTLTSDARMPPVGTVIQKRDRAGAIRCECTIVDGGVEYKDRRYTSLSSAAVAASKDLGLTAKTLDGWAWWGLKVRTAPVNRSGVAALTRTFEKYRERVSAILQGAAADNRAKLEEVLRAQVATLTELAGPPSEVHHE
jgi:hypothetical protein